MVLLVNSTFINAKCLKRNPPLYRISAILEAKLNIKMFNFKIHHPEKLNLISYYVKETFETSENVCTFVIVNLIWNAHYTMLYTTC